MRPSHGASGMGPERPHSSLESTAEETPVVQGGGTTPWRAPPHPWAQSRWPQAPTWHRGGRSICPPARSDLRKTQRQGNAPSLKGFGRTPGVTPVPSLWCDSPTRTVSSEPCGDSLGSWWPDCPAAPASGLPSPRTPGLPVVGPRAEAMGLGPWPPPARGGGQDPSPQVQLCVGLF